MNLVDACQRAISIDSSKSHGTSDIALYYAELAVSMGLMAEVLDESFLGAPQKLLIVRPSDARASQDFVLSSYLDTRDPEDYSAWTKTGANPFSASVEGNKLYGLGAAEPKIDFACKLFALAEHAEKKYSKTNPVLVGGFGAEGGMGAMRLFRKRILKPKMALVGQATRLRMADHAPGYAILEVKVPFSAEEKSFQQQMQFAENVTTQTKMFSSNETLTKDRDLSENPISQLLSYLKNLPGGLSLVSADGGVSPTQLPDAAWLEIQLNDSLKESILPKLASLYEHFTALAGELRGVTHPEFSPKHSSVNIGSIKTKPDGVYVYGSCKFVPNVTRDHYEKWLNNLEAGCKDIGAEFQLIDFREPFEGSIEGPLGKALENRLKQESMNAEPLAGHQCSEANLFSRFKVETLLFGAGVFDRGTSVANENISIDDLHKAQKIYSDLIKELCS